MGSLEELAAALLGEETQKAIAAENPYFAFAEPAANIAGSALKIYQSNPSAYSGREAALYGGLAGAIQGALTGFGKDYQNKLTDRYNTALAQAIAGGTPSVEGLPDALFGRAKQGGVLFRVMNQAQRDELANAGDQQTKQEIARAFIQANPSLFRLRSASGGTAAPAAGVEGNLLAEQESAVNRLIDQGVPGGQAGELVGKVYSAKREELNRQYQRVEEAEKAGADLAAMVSQLRRATAEAGNTGAAGQMRHWLAGAAGLAGNEGQQKKYAAGQEVESFSNEVVKQMGRAFKGPMSDRDVQIMLRAAPGLGTEEATNQAILDRWEYIAELQRTYAEFMRAAQARGVPVSEAESAWSKLKKENPYVIKQGSDYVINPAWFGGGNPLSGGGTAPVVGGTFQGQKIKRVTKKK